MKIRIEIKTPDGQAYGVVHGSNLRLNILRRLLGINLKKDSIYVNEKNNLITWHVEGDIRTCMKINRNVAMYNNIVSGIFNSKQLKKAVKRHMTKDQQEELRHMLQDMTHIEVINE